MAVAAWLTMGSTFAGFALAGGGAVDCVAVAVEWGENWVARICLQKWCFW